jgi:hypothetical protein
VSPKFSLSDEAARKPLLLPGVGTGFLGHPVRSLVVMKMCNSDRRDSGSSNSSSSSGGGCVVVVVVVVEVV